MSALCEGAVVSARTTLPEPPVSYIESFMALVFSYHKVTPPDELTRELAYRMLRQKMALLRIVEHRNTIYVVTLQKGSIVIFEVQPPEEEDESRKFRGWKYRTVRDPRQVPPDVLKAAIETLKTTS